MKRLILLVLAICLLLSGTAQAAPKLTILFTGNSLGKYQACPTCGFESLGGLDRRATLFERERAKSGALVTLSSGYEYASYMKGGVGSDALCGALAQAYGMLGYDAGLVTPLEREYAARAGVLYPEAFAMAGAEAQTRIVERGGVRVGVVLFPALKALKTPPDAALVQSVVRAAEELKGKGVSLIVGLSCWGQAFEAQFLRQAPESLDVLLGGGPGVGVGIPESAGERTLWVRPEYEGRSVTRLQFDDLPVVPGGGWNGAEHVQYERIELNRFIRGDGSISALFAWL